MGRDKVIDFEAFQRETGLDTDIIKELYNTFLDEVIQERHNIERFYNNNEAERLLKALHNLRGISGNYKAGRVFERAGNMEYLLKTDKRDNLNSMISELFDAITEAADEIKQYLSFKED